MSELRPWQMSKPFPVHRSWEVHWATDLKDAGLRSAIWSNPRFSKRIIKSLLPAPDTPPPAPSTHMAKVMETLIIRAARQNILREIGLQWLAPSLVGRLLNARTRAECGQLTQAEMGLIVKTRDHADTRIVGSMDAQTDPKSEGMKCLYAWLATLPEAYDVSMLLLLPALEGVTLSEPADQLEARAALINRIFGDAV